MCQFHDISRYRELQLLWRQTVSNAPIGMALLDLDGHWTEVNEKLCELVGYDRQELIGSSGAMLIDDLDDRNAHGAAFAALCESRETSATLEVRFRHQDGAPFWLLIRLSMVPGADDRPVYLVGQYEPLGSGVRLSEERFERLTRMALHDPLTGLANRTLLSDRVEQELAELGERGGVLAVLMIDLDRFKPVNDRHGHVVGDQLLTAVAQELISAVRATDTVARLGGDEFVVAAWVPDFAEAEALRDRVVRRLDGSTVVSGLSLTMTASVGLATTQNPKTPSHFLLDRADQQMYVVKQRVRA
ncbi:GGDEF domain-containing protein [Allosaccharopolyspora coralli]|uniref:GGDEF domain-containing protein n=1 Tax=Allosaccharopolyspora coralli TaxID=2665642 RepID=UPI001E4C84E5|nr:sensor domain-containing diguanylate cyclase [Allosaccharopolyspora coralli]